MSQIEKILLPTNSKLTHYSETENGVKIIASKEGIFFDNRLIFKDPLTTWYKYVLTLSFDVLSYDLLAATNRGFI